MTKIIRFLRLEPVLCVAAIAAGVSCFVIPPTDNYINYIDFRVLALLFCLMLVVAALASTGLFSILAGAVIKRTKTVRGLVLVMTLLCFFSSMLITNDVSLITFVPFSLTVLFYAGRMENAIYMIVLQTVAANLGSMLTPLGNPQNLFLYAYYKMEASDFLSVTLPLSAVSLAMLLLLIAPIKSRSITLGKRDYGNSLQKDNLCLYGLLFLLCLLTVFCMIPYMVTTAVICLVILIKDKSLFKKVDYALLLTFVAFFVFVGNLSQMEAVRGWVRTCIEGRELLASVALSQVISNVPAAMMLSGFTDHADALVAGVNIGGLGTLIASLASLISFKLYCRNEGAKPGRYLAVFSAVNILMLSVLYIICRIMIEWRMVNG